MKKLVGHARRSDIVRVSCLAVEVEGEAATAREDTVRDPVRREQIEDRHIELVQVDHIDKLSCVRAHATT